MKQFVLALILIILFTSDCRSQWLHHERLGHDPCSFVLSCLNLLLLGSLFIELFLFDDFS